MSIKQQLAQTIEGLSDAVTIEEAIDQIYWAMKLKQASIGTSGQGMAAALDALAARSAISDIADPVQWEREVRADRALPERD